LVTAVAGQRDGLAITETAIGHSDRITPCIRMHRETAMLHQNSLVFGYSFGQLEPMLPMKQKQYFMLTKNLAAWQTPSVV